MYNFHPPLSAFPVALLSTALLCEIAFWISSKSWLRPVIAVNLVLGTLGILASFFSGYQASELANQTFQISDEIISLHHTVGRLALFGVIPTATLFFVAERAKFNQTFFRAAFRVFLVTIVGLVFATGYLGGKLVFEHGAAVKAKVEPKVNAEQPH